MKLFSSQDEADKALNKSKPLSSKVSAIIEPSIEPKIKPVEKVSVESKPKILKEPVIDDIEEKVVSDKEIVATGLTVVPLPTLVSALKEMPQPVIKNEVNIPEPIKAWRFSIERDTEGRMSNVSVVAIE